MRPAGPVEMPPERQATYRKAVRLEIATIAFLLCGSALIYVTMGASQAMRTGFFDDLLSTFPAIAFLIASRICRRRPDENHPYGWHKATSVAFLSASLALAAVGVLLLVEALGKFAAGERTTIGAMEVFGRVVWAGWPMLAAIVVTSIPAVFLGRAKLKLAPKLHDKVLFADADMMKADWMVGAGTAAAVIGVGFGWWWMDPLAAALISLDIIHDGFRNTAVAVNDLMERTPQRTDGSGPEPWPERARERLLSLPWVLQAEVRMRESGHVFYSEAFLLVRPGTGDVPARLQEAENAVKALNWRLHDVVVTALPSPATVTGEDERAGVD